MNQSLYHLQLGVKVKRLKPKLISRICKNFFHFTHYLDFTQEKVTARKTKQWTDTAYQQTPKQQYTHAFFPPLPHITTSAKQHHHHAQCHAPTNAGPSLPVYYMILLLYVVDWLRKRDGHKLYVIVCSRDLYNNLNN